MIKRETYIKTISLFIGKPVIKVLTGMRRCGKSVILRLLREELLEQGIPEQNIIYLNFESMGIRQFLDADSLYNYIVSITRDVSGRFYIMLDEVQRVKNWEHTVASLRVDFDCDIFITGSNNSLWSGNIGELLAGRYIEIRIHPLSFAEHLLFTKEGVASDINSQFMDYLHYGGLPGIHEMGIHSPAVIPYLLDIYNSVLLKDVISRNNIRDTELLERIINYLMDNTGNIFSAKRISDFLKNQNCRIGTETVYNYLDALEAAFLLKKVKRWDIKGKRILETQEKYYFEDFGIKNALLGYSSDSISGLLENIVFLELRRRGYEIFIGQGINCEVDFIARLRDQTNYFQVSYLLASPETIEREFTPLLNIKDNFPKYVLSMDEFDFSRQGIQHKNIRKWLLE